MKPEEEARIKIDQMLRAAGWEVVDRLDYSPTMNAVAIREGLMNGNREADYFLMLGGKAFGVLEAKKASVDVSAAVVTDQAYMYARGVPDCYQSWMKPLSYGFTSNGNDTYFVDFREQEPVPVAITQMPTPKQVARALNLTGDPFIALPALPNRGLRACQYEAITELETSFRQGQKRALMVLATGSGKTYTACMAAYRLLAFTPMRRILFLVDRNNLGKQAEGEFGMFRLTENGDPFNTIFSVNRLRSAQIPSDSNVVISTIQRLFSLLTNSPLQSSRNGGETDSDDEEDEYEPDQPVELGDDLSLPPDFFDLIIIDECHRSIYGNWRKVLDYFTGARLVGLTATPVPETLAFFNNNRIVNYTLQKSIEDGVNVEGRIYRIKTEATENGGAIRQGDKLRRVTRYTGQVETISQQETRQYTREELNRSVINPAQIKLVLETYRDSVYTEMFTDPQREPNFDYLPKTLIFALNEQHATNIVRIAREVFGHTAEDDPYVQKITYSAGDSNELIRQFRISREFRIAVTCTLVATGTDVKPLEVLIFMRDVASEPLYEQMKGRGVRTIGDEQLRNVTPNAFTKDNYFLVDAVGVTEHAMHTPSLNLDDEPTHTLTFRRLLELLCHGNLEDDKLQLLAGRLSRIYNKANTEQRDRFIQLAGIDMKELATRIYDALSSGQLPPYHDINEPNNERKQLVAPLTHHAEAREYLLILLAGFIETLMPGEDQLISKGFSVEEAQQLTSSFEQYCTDHRDEIEALRIIWNNEGEPINYEMLRDLESRLKMADSHFSPHRLWNSYAIVHPAAVRHTTTREEREALTNIIQLVRYAFRQTDRLETLYSGVSQRFALWCGQRHSQRTQQQIEIMSQIVEYIASNVSTTVQDLRRDDATQAAQLIKAFGGVQAATEALLSVSTFILYRKHG